MFAAKVTPLLQGTWKSKPRRQIESTRAALGQPPAADNQARSPSNTDNTAPLLLRLLRVLRRVFAQSIRLRVRRFVIVAARAVTLSTPLHAR